MTLRRIFTLALPLLYVAGLGVAQAPPQDGSWRNERFAVKGSWGPGYIVVADSGVSSQIDCSKIARIADWDAKHPKERRPSTLEIAFKITGDAVVMTATAFFGVKAGANDTPRTLRQLSHKHVGTYSARLNESATLNDVAKFGMEPLTVQVVTAKDPGAGHPTFISEAPSIQIELMDQNRQNFTLALHNSSSREVTGYAICVTRIGNASCSGTPGDGTRPLIAAGGTIAIPYFLPRSGRETATGFEADPDPASVVLKGAVFADGTVEGLGIRPLTRDGLLSLTK